MNTRKVIVLLLIAAVGFGVYKIFLDERPHNPRVFGPPAKTEWKPVGARDVGLHNYDIIPEPTTWHAIHVDVGNSDSVWALPRRCLNWTGWQSPRTSWAMAP